jgi:hypothetical protein
MKSDTKPSAQTVRGTARHPVAALEDEDCEEVGGTARKR